MAIIGIANSETDVTHDVSVVKSGRGAEFNSGTIELRVWDASMGVFVFSIRVDILLRRLDNLNRIPGHVE
jgi:hypothetical protein